MLNIYKNFKYTSYRKYYCDIYIIIVFLICWLRVVYSDANRICVILLKTKIKRDTCYIQEIFFFIFSSFFMKYTHKYSRHTSVLYDKTVLSFSLQLYIIIIIL